MGSYKSLPQRFLKSCSVAKPLLIPPTSNLAGFLARTQFSSLCFGRLSRISTKAHGSSGVHERRSGCVPHPTTTQQTRYKGLDYSSSCTRNGNPETRAGSILEGSSAATRRERWMRIWLTGTRTPKLWVSSRETRLQVYPQARRGGAIVYVCNSFRLRSGLLLY